MRTQTDLKTGVLTGDVQITTLGENGRAYDAPVRINGRKADPAADSAQTRPLSVGVQSRKAIHRVMPPANSAASVSAGT